MRIDIQDKSYLKQNSAYFFPLIKEEDKSKLVNAIIPSPLPINPIISVVVALIAIQLISRAKRLDKEFLILFL